jgi:hypothetical protein
MSRCPEIRHGPATDLPHTFTDFKQTTVIVEQSMTPQTGMNSCRRVTMQKCLKLFVMPDDISVCIFNITIIGTAYQPTRGKIKILSILPVENRITAGVTMGTAGLVRN